MPSPYILTLESPSADLALVGGKGASLSYLAQAGFPVPPGFILTTAAYDAFVAANHLGPPIQAALDGLSGNDAAALESASNVIRSKFEGGELPVDLREQLLSAYREMFGEWGLVAVRSSATAEDLPELSFAGQQDTYLNISGPGALLRAVVSCWASLWTGRAIGYRDSNGVSQERLSLAVVVQSMIQAEAAGVLFTANPLNGRRTESAIDATLGPGEALVSGQVEPDHYLVDTLTRRIVERRLGTKSAPAEVDITAARARQKIQALPDAAIFDLVALGQDVQAHFGAPQDIEWTWAEGTLSLVQSRPITSLYPLPADLQPEGDLRVLASFGAFQGVLDPFTPLGIDALRSLAAAVARLLGYEATWETQGALKVAGERIFVNLTPLLRNGFGRRVVRAGLGQAEPGVGEAVREVLADPRLAITAARPGPRLLLRIAPLLLPLAGRSVLSLVRPELAQQKAERSVELTIEHYRNLAARATTVSERLLLLDEIIDALPRFLLVELLTRIVPGMAALNHLYRLGDGVPGGRRLVLEVLRGLPHNVTTEMDLALWDIARRIQDDASSSAFFSGQDSSSLAGAYLECRLPPVAQQALEAFLQRYGMRGLVEIDLGRPRWRDDPAPVMEAVQSYLHITDPALAPDAVFARGAAAARQAVVRLEAELRKTKRGRLKAASAAWAARRVRALAGLRESPKFTIVNFLGLVREALLDLANELTQAGMLRSKDEVFFLSLAELSTVVDAQEPVSNGVADLSSWAERLRARVEARRGRYARELKRRQVPRVLLSDGTCFYEGVRRTGTGDEAGAGRLVGSPVSPGVVEGKARIVLNPATAQFLPGEILVCPGTDPSWTPLFLAAAGLVMEVGGMMTHGSVVAREYGIPAVVGVTEATQRLRQGQRIRVDGARGTVDILD